MKKAKEEPKSEHQWLLGVLTVSLMAWLILGLFHNVAYVRSLGVLFWVLLGWSAALTSPRDHARKRLKTKFLLFGLLILSAALGYQIKLIHDRQISPSFQSGFYGTRDSSRR